MQNKFLFCRLKNFFTHPLSKNSHLVICLTQNYPQTKIITSEKGNNSDSDSTNNKSQGHFYKNSTKELNYHEYDINNNYNKMICDYLSTVILV